ncbi:hypothetical protein NLI96_g8639 [Meripilus lineatus]|uniref:F-box domain-containing protein n=1 Tax=Meripilus lineatus TaxID=2056292 RepID=A0AAD5UWW9_9APHY|nr:hypothetical protein NLI96_g8639 [Physisporinus lineatus]
MRLSQDISPEPLQKNMFSPPTGAARPHAIRLHLPSPPPPPSLPPPPLQSPLPSAIASSSSADLSSSFVPPQSLPISHFMPILSHDAPVPNLRSVRPGWSPETGLPRDVWLEVLDILYECHRVTALMACGGTCKFLREQARDRLLRLRERVIRSWRYEDIDKLVEDIHDAPRDAKHITSILFMSQKRDTKFASPAVALSAAPVRLADLRPTFILAPVLFMVAHSQMSLKSDSIGFSSIHSWNLHPLLHPFPYWQPWNSGVFLVEIKRFRRV